MNCALNPYSQTPMMSKMYSLVYVNLYMINAANNKVVSKVIRPSYVGEGLSYIRCRYFVDVEPDTWYIKISAKGNTVSADDDAAMKVVDGVKPANYLVAKKLVAPQSPIEYTSPMIMQGILSFTPVRQLDGTIYKYYVLEKVRCYEKVIIVIKYDFINRLWED